MFDLNTLNEWVNNLILEITSDFTNAGLLETMYLFMFKYWGWLVFIFIFTRYAIWPQYMYVIQNRWFDKNITPILLAIDVPKQSEQSIQAMENFFDYLQGAHGTMTLWEEYIEGKFQLSFSCELVSIEGNIQFLIRTPKHLRNFVEAAVYSQYPDAEITEVEDYTNTVPIDYPNDTHDLWGAEFTLSANEYLPLKSYLKFEHRFSEVFVDPLAALLETMSSIGKGEQMWLQFLIKPLAVDWGQKEGRAFVDKLMGVPPKPVKRGIIGDLVDELGTWVMNFGQSIAGVEFENVAAQKDKKDAPPSLMMHLSPGQKEKVEATERKISKLAFSTKIRYVYIAEKDKMNKALGANGIVGAIKQFTDMNLNGLKPDMKGTCTSTPNYILINYRRNTRKNTIIRGYIYRDRVRGSKAKPLCSEELAGLWHFPSMYIKAPMLKTTDFRKQAAPGDLPFSELPPEIMTPSNEAAEEKLASGPKFDYDNDAFEQQFAKDKETFEDSRPARAEKLKEIAQKEEIKLKEIKKQEEVFKKKRIESTPQPAVKPNKNSGSQPGNLPFID